MDRYTDKYHPLYVSGTYSIYTSAVVRHQHYITYKRYKHLLSEINNMELPLLTAKERDSLNKKLSKKKQYQLSDSYNYKYNPRRKFENIQDLKTKYGIILQPQPTNSINDPLNWSSNRKALHFIILLLLTAFFSALSNDASAPTDSINQLTSISYDSLNDSAGILFVAIAVSTWLLSPLNFLFGRKFVLFLGCLFALFGSLLYALIENVGDVYGSQILIGFSLGSVDAHVQLCLSSIFFRHQLGSIITIYNLAYSLGTYLGPMIANFISFRHDFRWVGWSGLIASSIVLVIVIFLLEENSFNYSKYNNNNSEDITLNLGFIQKGILSNDESNDVLLQGYNDEKWSYWRRISMFKNNFRDIDNEKNGNPKGNFIITYFKLLLTPIYCLRFPVVIYSGCIMGLQNAILTFYLTTEDTELYDPPFNYSANRVAIMNVPCIIGSVIGCLYAGSLTDYFILWIARKKDGIVESEYRLYFAFVSGLIGAIGLLMFGMGISRNLSSGVFYVGLAFISYMFSSSNNLAMLYIMDTYRDLMLECLVAANFINNIIGCIFTFACSPWLESSGIENTYIALAVITLAVMGFAGVFIKYGKTWRKYSNVYYVSLIDSRQKLL